MKKLIYSTAIALSLLGGSLMTISCDDILDTRSESTMYDPQIFSKYELAYGAITGIYHSFGETNSYRGRILPWYGFNTDIEWYNSSDSNNEKSQIATYACTSNNGQLNMSESKDPWSKLYEAVERCNLAIEGLREYGNTESDSRMAQLLGEALTLRAVIYMDIINCWGDVPARFEPISQEILYVPRSSKDVIFKQLITDLQEAEKIVAWPTETSATATVEHINKAFVKGLLARICMQAAGYSVREDGTNKLSNDPELSKDVLYPIALQACKEVMEKEGTYCKLEDNFEDIFINNCKDVIAAGGESLWEMPFANTPTPRGRLVKTFGVKHNQKDTYGPTGGGDAGPTPNFFYDYSINDKRRDVTCVPYLWSKTTVNVQELNALNSWYFGKYRYEWMDREGISDDDGVNKQYMRYADVVLMRAELENELNSPSAAAPYLKKIRQRAFAQTDWSTEVDAYVTSVSGSKDAMFKAIVDERAFEFCGEMLRKADLIRWGLLKSKLDETKQKMRDLRTLSGDYSDLNNTLYYNMVDFKWIRNKKENITENAALQIYGLNHGETGVPSGTYEFKKEWIKEDKIADKKLESLYLNDPDKFMYWPIFDYNIEASNGTLSNYSWYTF